MVPTAPCADGYDEYRRGSLFGAVDRTLDIRGTGGVHYGEALDLSPEIVLPAEPVLVQ